MSKFLNVATLAFALAAGGAHAANDAMAGDKPADGRATQQSRMKTCNVDAKAKELKGDERKAFMGECLRKKA